MNIRIPIKILTPRIRGKNNSLFYAGRNIASVKTSNREYVLTTSGSYSFRLKENEKRYTYEPGDIPSRSFNRARNSLTDSRIKVLDNNLLIENWGWFGINVWEDKRFMSDEAPNTYGIYDEALKAFKEFIEKDI
jgi:hypothetical protein